MNSDTPPGNFEMLSRLNELDLCGLFKASALWADAFYKSKGPSVRLSVCPSVCLFVHVFTFEVPFKRFFSPTSKVGCPIFLEIRSPWGKVIKRSGLTYEHFCLKIVKNCRTFFFVLFLLILPYKTWGKPRFPMD